MTVIQRPRTLYEKLFDEHVIAERGDGTVLLYVDRHLIHECTSPQAFDGLRRRSCGVRKAKLTLATSDRNVPTTSRKHYKSIGSFIKNEESRRQCLTLERNSSDYGIKYLGLDSDRQGIVHVIGPEQGFTLPGLTVVCGDSHTATNGAFGALAFGIGTTEVEHVLATQALVASRSKNMKIQIDGKLGACVTSKDVILHVINLIGTAGGTGMVIEYAGSAIEDFSMESRMSLCNMSIEAGARAGLVSPDEKTYEYVKGRPLAPESGRWQEALAYWSTLRSDPGAIFNRVVPIDANEISPTVSWGTSPEQVVPISGFVPNPDDFDEPHKQEACRNALQYMALRPGTRMQDIHVDKIFIGSCTNGRIEDLRSAARILKGQKIAPNLKVALAVPGSGMVKRMAESEGLDLVFKRAGFEWREAGCSMCVGLNDDSLLPFERCASTSNRNFEGRQGFGSRTHLMSPQMAAATAIKGRLADVRMQDLSAAPEPGHLAIGLDIDDTKETDEAADQFSEEQDQAIDQSIQADHVPSKMFQTFKGLVATLDRSNVDTDCIMPKQFCKTTRRSGLGRGLFYNLRYNQHDVEEPEFVLNKDQYRKAGILLVTGPNFGCGSSREHVSDPVGIVLLPSVIKIC